MRVYNASRFLLKPGEHTWGLPNVGDNGNWTNADFMKVRKGMYTSIIQEESIKFKAAVHVIITLFNSTDIKFNAAVHVTVRITVTQAIISADASDRGSSRGT